MTHLMINITCIFILILIIIGAVYITCYEKAPLSERIQVFSVGFGMYIGIILKIWGGG